MTSFTSPTRVVFRVTCTSSTVRLEESTRSHEPVGTKGKESTNLQISKALLAPPLILLTFMDASRLDRTRANDNSFSHSRRRVLQTGLDNLLELGSRVRLEINLDLVCMP